MSEEPCKGASLNMPTHVGYVDLYRGMVLRSNYPPTRATANKNKMQYMRSTSSPAMVRSH